jgi:hypothetical protein
LTTQVTRFLPSAGAPVPRARDSSKASLITRSRRRAGDDPRVDRRVAGRDAADAAVQALGVLADEDHVDLARLHTWSLKRPDMPWRTPGRA